MAKIETVTVEKCIYLKSGSYYVVKRNKWSDPFSTLEAARLERDRIETEQAPRPQGGPFADYIRKYYYSLYLEKMRDNTKKVYTGIYERSIIPYFATKKINDISKLDVMEFRQYLSTQRLNNRTINGHLALLDMALKAAEELKFIKSNPAKGLKPLHETKKERIILTEKKILKLINKIEHPFKYAIALAGLAGARAGEVMGFKWEDFELTNKATIKFVRQVNMLHELDELKSRGSAVTLPIMKPLTRLLIEWKTICPDSEWLFQGEVSKYIGKLKGTTKGELKYVYHQKNLNKRKWKYRSGTDLSNWWGTQRSKYGLTGMRFHDFRHSFATNAITKCKNIKTAQKLCRHSNIKTTLEIYAHIHPEQLEEVWDWDF